MKKPLFKVSNPFQITSPEDMSAHDAVSLFVKVYTDFPKIIDPGHVFLIGPRGSGKSMMFRYLMPDCQMLGNRCELRELPFLGIYIPLKNANFNLAEFQRIENIHASDVLSSHLLTTHFALMTFKLLKEMTKLFSKRSELEVTKGVFADTFLPLVKRASWGSPIPLINKMQSVSDVFGAMESICTDFYDQVLGYVKHLSFRQDIVPYEGALCDYIQFLFPMLCALRDLDFLPRGPVYLLIDDAHNLSSTQASVLNTWVSTRTSSKVSLKISTQPGYETYHTISGTTIDTPHDFSEINISTIYTGSRKSNYRDRVSAIVKKRLKMADIDRSPEEFFPEDKEQEDEIRSIAKYYQDKHKAGKGKGTRPSDDAVRYARPDYIAQLAGTHKASHSYSYAGFDQLVHLSSGIIRFFIEPAHRMFSSALAKPHPNKILQIPPGIQSEVMRAEAERFLFDDLEKLESDKSVKAPPKALVRKLSNLVHALGGMFRQCLLSKRSERRVFCIAFSDQPGEEVMEVLDLGVRLGYFHKSTIGKKDSSSGGRTRLFILSRRLAPIWHLDPTGFAGYLFVTNNLIEQAIREPRSLLRRLDKKGIDSETQAAQLTLL